MPALSPWKRFVRLQSFRLTRNGETHIFNQMVKYSSHSLDGTFSALSDPTRRSILARLAQGESTVTELARPFIVSLPAISKHLRVLEAAGLLIRKRDGRIHRCRLNAKPMKDASDWITRYRQFWEERLDALAEYLEATQKEEKPSWPKEKSAPKPSYRSNGRTRPPGKGSSGRGRTRKK
ncbi:MAG: metalloregulator ArsR/SmtB family transcription factor [bacterium]